VFPGTGKAPFSFILVKEGVESLGYVTRKGCAESQQTARWGAKGNPPDKRSIYFSGKVGRRGKGFRRRATSF